MFIILIQINVLFHPCWRPTTPYTLNVQKTKNAKWQRKLGLLSHRINVWYMFLFDLFTVYTSIAARGGGGSFKRLKLYNSEEHLPIESFVTTLIHWTFFSDDANKVGICWLCRSGQLHVTPGSRWSLPRCHRSVRNDMRLFLRTKKYPVQLRTTKFWKVLPQYYSVLQSTTPESTTPVLLRTTKYYFVLQSTSPVLLRTTKYYSSTTPYYKRTTKY